MTKRPFLRVSLLLLTLSTAAHAQDATDLDGARAGGDVDAPRASAHLLPVAPALPSEDESRWDAADSLYHFNSRTNLTVAPGMTGSFQVTPEVLIFSSLSKNFKLPGNPEYFSPGPAAAMASGVGSSASLAPLKLKQASAVNLDMGALYKSGLFRASASVFFMKFKDRIISSFEPAAAVAPGFNVGNSTVKGLTMEAATVPVLGFSAYASATYAQSNPDHAQPLLGNALSALADGGRLAAPFPVTGVLFPESPKKLAAMALQYSSGPLLVNLAGKFTGRRNITVVGDQSLAGFTTFDLNVALRLPADRLLKNPTLRFNVSNFTDKRFPVTQLPSLYGGAPRYTSITLQSDF